MLDASVNSCQGILYCTDSAHFAVGKPLRMSAATVQNAYSTRPICQVIICLTFLQKVFILLTICTGDIVV